MEPDVLEIIRHASHYRAGCPTRYRRISFPNAGETKIEHFGQVLPIEEVERVIDMVDSITHAVRLPLHDDRKGR